MNETKKSQDMLLLAYIQGLADAWIIVSHEIATYFDIHCKGNISYPHPVLSHLSDKNRA